MLKEEPMRNHRSLKVFHLADRLALLVYSRTKGFPRAEEFGLCSQMRRAAVSIAANIVEGAARRSERDFARMLEIAYGSSRELEYDISLALRLGYLSEKHAEDMSDLVSQSGKALRALVLRVQAPRDPVLASS
jgi:four helix bundle protein